jgi:hypothetical protein
LVQADPCEGTLHRERDFVITLRERVTTLEHEVKEVRILASGAHQDVGDTKAALRAHISSLEALNRTQREMHKEMRTGFAAIREEMNARFAEVGAKIAEVDTKIAGVDTKIVGVDARFAGMDARFAGVDARFDAMDTKMAEGFAEVGLAMAEIMTKLTTVLEGPKPAV